MAERRGEDKAKTNVRDAKVAKRGYLVKKDDKQKTLDSTVKKVSFNEEEEINKAMEKKMKELEVLCESNKELLAKIKTELKESTKIRSNVKEEICNLKAEYVELEKRKLELKEYEIKVSTCINKLEKKIEVWERNLQERLEVMDKMLVEGRMLGRRNSAGASQPTETDASEVISEAGYSVRSTWSRASFLTNDEMWKIKRYVNEQEKKDRLCNIALKNFKIKEMDECGKEVREFIKNKMNIDVDVLTAWRSGSVILARLADLEQKSTVMKNKYKLKGTEVYIESDLSWEERKIQVDMNKWAKVQREKGLVVKVGYAKVKVNGVWKKWKDLKKECDKDGNASKDKGEEIQYGENNQHFA